MSSLVRGADAEAGAPLRDSRMSLERQRSFPRRQLKAAPRPVDNSWFGKSQSVDSVVLRHAESPAQSVESAVVRASSKASWSGAADPITPASTGSRQRRHVLWQRRSHPGAMNQLYGSLVPHGLLSGSLQQEENCNAMRPKLGLRRLPTSPTAYSIEKIQPIYADEGLTDSSVDDRTSSSFWNIAPTSEAPRAFFSSALSVLMWFGIVCGCLGLGLVLFSVAKPLVSSLVDKSGWTAGGLGGIQFDGTSLVTLSLTLGVTAVLYCMSNVRPGFMIAEPDKRKRIRVFVGNLGFTPYEEKDDKPDEDGKTQRPLSELDMTGSFRESLLMYASEYWLNDKNGNAPSANLGLYLINFGDTETALGDGTSTSKPNTRALYLPLSRSYANSLSRGEAVSDGSKENKISRAQKQKGKENSKESGDHSGGVTKLDGRAVVYLEIYGGRGMEKLNALVERVMDYQRNELSKLQAAPTDGKAEPLYWFELKGFNSKHELGPEPKYSKKPILCGDGTPRARKEYVKSLFMPNRDRLVGESHSLIDQFHNTQGKWRTPGVQRKINLLCYGPPGTGKSKLVRTLANYLQRHVVSFTLGQIVTETQITAVLDELKYISKEHPEHPEIRYQDVLFVIEEIDTDERGICLKREAATTQTKDEAKNDSDSEDDDDKQRKGKWGGKGKWKGKNQNNNNNTTSNANSDATPLSLGGLLRALDGGSETPGRLILMTTNREQDLDPAFKRPGRVKKVRLDTMKFTEFKEMVLHYQTTQGSIPTAELWTQPVDQLARAIVVEGFEVLKKFRIDDLDSRSLGLSPALLEELCMDSHSLQEVIDGLKKELEKQVMAVGFESTTQRDDGTAVSAQDIWNNVQEKFKYWNWRVHTLWVATMQCVREADRLQAEKAWPEPRLEERVQAAEAQGSSGGPRFGLLGGKTFEASEVVDMLLQNEATLNTAVECGELDHSRKEGFKTLRYKLQVELSHKLKDIVDNPTNKTTLRKVLETLVQELDDRWETAWRTKDRKIRMELVAHMPDAESVLGQDKAPKPPVVERLNRMK